MERRTDSPYPRIDRLVIAIIGLVLVAGTVLFMWSDRAHDWRFYQYEFRQLVADRFGQDRAATVPEGPQQVWVADLGRRTLTRFTFDAGEDESPVWTPDGKRLLFVGSEKGELRRLYAMEAEGGTPRPISSARSA